MASLLRSVAESNKFQNAVFVAILCAAVLVGLETVPSIAAGYSNILEILNHVIVGVFVVEALIKMGQHGWRFYRYFRDPWNVFDFVITAVCFLPINSQHMAVMRLARIFRALRLVTAIPRLRLLVTALLHSIPSMGYVGALMLLLFYVYGVMGVFFFRDNDPVRFGDLGKSMLTLFTVVTQEGWNEVLYCQMYGSDVYPYDNPTGAVPDPQAHPLLAPAYFVSFVIIGTMIMLNLFIGVILNSMEEVQETLEREHLALSSTHESPDATHVALATIVRRLDEIDGRLQQLQEQSARDESPVGAGR